MVDLTDEPVLEPHLHLVGFAAMADDQLHPRSPWVRPTNASTSAVSRPRSTS